MYVLRFCHVYIGGNGKRTILFCGKATGKPGTTALEPLHSEYLRNSTWPLAELLWHSNMVKDCQSGASSAVALSAPRFCSHTASMLEL